MLLITMAIPVTGLPTVETDVMDNPFKIFFRCYVELVYHGEYESVGTHPIFGIVLRFLDNDDAEITVYSEENGDMLWHNEGIHRLRIFFLVGYTDTNEHTSTTYGQALLLRALAI
jgi:hypothetical protein